MSSAPIQEWLAKAEAAASSKPNKFVAAAHAAVGNLAKVAEWSEEKSTTPRTVYQLMWEAFTHRDKQKVQEYLNELLEKTPHDKSMTHKSLAQAYAAAGNYEDGEIHRLQVDKEYQPRVLARMVEAAIKRKDYQAAETLTAKHEGYWWKTVHMNYAEVTRVNNSFHNLIPDLVHWEIIVVIWQTFSAVQSQTLQLRSNLRGLAEEAT